MSIAALAFVDFGKHGDLLISFCLVGTAATVPHPLPPQVFPRIKKEQKLRVWFKYRSKRMGYFTRMCLVVARVFGSFVEVVNRAKISEASAIGKKKMGESLCFQRHTSF